VVRIWVRATLDYDDEHAFAADLRDDFREHVALWDSVFEMPYRVFRSRLRAIARENLEQIEGAQVSSWEDIPAGALVLPCDDDDWFRPDVAAVLERELRPGIAGVRWTSSFLEVPTDWRHHLGIWRRHVQGPRPLFLCTTNNYALFASQEAKDLLARHTQASLWVGAQPDGTVPFLRDRLSLMNRTLASRTTLGLFGGPLSRRRLLRKLARYRRLYLTPLRPDLAWAQPYADRMHELMGDLELRR
jgi:hypothetical protein